MHRWIDIRMLTSSLVGSMASARKCDRDVKYAGMHARAAIARSVGRHESAPRTSAPFEARAHSSIILLRGGLLHLLVAAVAEGPVLGVAALAHPQVLARLGLVRHLQCANWNSVMHV